MSEPFLNTWFFSLPWDDCQFVHWLHDVPVSTNVIFQPPRKHPSLWVSFSPRKFQCKFKTRFLIDHLISPRSALSRFSGGKPREKIRRNQRPKTDLSSSIVLIHSGLIVPPRYLFSFAQQRSQIKGEVLPPFCQYWPHYRKWRHISVDFAFGPSPQKKCNEERDTLGPSVLSYPEKLFVAITSFSYQTLP